MKATLVLSALCVCVAGASAQVATPAPAPPAAKSAAPAPAKTNPNVVVLRSETKFWDDAALKKPVTFTLKDADARAAVALLAQTAGLPMSVIMPPPTAVVTPPAPSSRRTREVAAPTPAKPVEPVRVSLEFKNKTVRDVMLTLADAYHLSWRKDGATYVLRDTNFVDNLRAESRATANTDRRTGYQNNGANNGYGNNRNRRGSREVAPGIYREPRRGRR